MSAIPYSSDAKTCLSRLKKLTFLDEDFPFFLFSTNKILLYYKTKRLRTKNLDILGQYFAQVFDFIDILGNWITLLTIKTVSLAEYPNSVPVIVNCPGNTKLRPQVKQALAANKNGRCNRAAYLL